MTLTYEGEEVSDINIDYFDTVPVAQALVILKTGVLRHKCVRLQVETWPCLCASVSVSHSGVSFLACIHSPVALLLLLLLLPPNPC